MQEAQSHRPRCRTGFTLIELLTVVSIIALLIGILLPSLARARDQAKRLKVRATLAAIEKGLEMFQNDFGEYPTSYTPNDDAIFDLPGGNTEHNCLWGGHLLARAMIGHDFNGIDAEGRGLRDGRVSGNSISVAQLATAPRRGPYVEATAVRDTDPRFGHINDGPLSGRLILIDDPYGSPILYYRAYRNASSPFSLDDCGSPPCRQYGETGDTLGVYRLWDNFGFTGVSKDDGAWGFWDFANTGLDIPAHPLADLGSLMPDRINRPPPYYPKGKTFPGFLHDEGALRASGVVKPCNPESFILIDAGKDGLYGTDDDVTNFERGG